MAGASPSDGLMSYPGYSLVGSYSSAEMQSVYFTAPANWEVCCFNLNSVHNKICSKYFVFNSRIQVFSSFIFTEPLASSDLQRFRTEGRVKLFHVFFLTNHFNTNFD